MTEPTDIPRVLRVSFVLRDGKDLSLNLPVTPQGEMVTRPYLTAAFERGLTWLALLEEEDPTQTYLIKTADVLWCKVVA